MSQTTPLLSDQKLLEILTLTKTPTAIHVGEEANIQFANDAMISIWGKDRTVIGKALEEALPELRGQPFIEMFARVWRDGVTISGSDAQAELTIDGRNQTFYFDFEYRPIKDSNGQTVCILHTAVDVTERFLKKEALERAYEKEWLLTREQEMNEELAAANGELSAANRELQQTRDSLYALNNELENRVALRTQELTAGVEREQAINEELLSSNEELIFVNGQLAASIRELERSRAELHQLNLKLRYSEQKLDDILRQLPSPVVVLRGQEQIIEVTNRAILSFWDKTKEEVTGRPMLEVFPELKSQPFPAQWKYVYETGESIINKEMPVNFIINGKKRLSYVDYYYQPIGDIDGVRSGVLATVIDVTHKVESRQRLEENKAELQELNDELSAINEEMAAANEQLIATRDALNHKVMELAQSEDKLKIAIETGRMGTWSINPATLKVSMSNFVKEMIGLPLDNSEIEIETILQAVKPAHHPALKEDLRNALKYGLTTDTEYQVTNLVTGEERWVRATGKVLSDSNDNRGVYTGMFMDITDRKLDELRKNDFIGMVSHELKTPLTSLTAIIQVANSRLKSSEDNFLVSALDKANNQVKKMSTMINGFLNISRLESGKIQLVKKQFYLNELALAIIEETRLTTSAHTIELLPCAPVQVYADPDKIGSVISNLLSNAVKYSPKGKLITVRCKVTGRGMELSVKDEGMGIKPGDIDYLFDRYYRVENPNYSHISGFGIGLYLSAEIIRQHGGEIGVESEPGKGSTFYFSLPVEGD